MSNRRASLVFVAGTILGGLIVWWVHYSPATDKYGDEPWALPNYSFGAMLPDIAQRTGDDAVYITGTLMGDGVGYPVNTWNVHCLRSDGNCTVSYVEEIGPGQLGSINEARWPIVSWTPTTIVIRDNVPSVIACVQSTITIHRQAKTVEYMSVPENADRIDCKQANKRYGPAKVEYWTIGSPIQPWERSGKKSGSLW